MSPRQEQTALVFMPLPHQPPSPFSASLSVLGNLLLCTQFCPLFKTQQTGNVTILHKLNLSFATGLWDGDNYCSFCFINGRNIWRGEVTYLKLHRTSRTDPGFEAVLSAIVSSSHLCAVPPLGPGRIWVYQTQTDLKNGPARAGLCPASHLV